VLLAFVEFLKARCFMELSVCPHKTIYTVGTTGAPALKIIEVLYANARVALPRKAEIAARLRGHV
jgi:hypothetical protein